jgi:hypothetical protein
MKKIINLVVCGLIVTGFSSCLKDKTIIGPDSDGAIKNVVEFQNIGPIKSGASAPFAVYIPFTLKPTDATASFEGIVNYAGTDVAPEDITVELAADPSIITTYNSKVAGAAYAPLTTGLYSFPATVTIPKGQRQAKFTVTVKPSAFDASKENALALRITSASKGTVSGNFGAVIFSMPLESIWQGTYHVYINNNYGQIDANIGNFDEADVALETVGPNKLQVQYIARTYSGNVQYQFSGDNSTITSVKAFNGATNYVTSIQSIDVIDAANGIFELHWTFANRGIVERWVKQK